MSTFPQADIDRAAADAAKQARDAESARMAGILGLPEAKGREGMAQQLAMTDGMTVDAAKALLLSAPKASTLEAPPMSRISALPPAGPPRTSRPRSTRAGTASSMPKTSAGA